MDVDRPITRHRFVVAAGGLVVAAATPRLFNPAIARASTPSLPDQLFTLGVASGDPTADGVVLWTRLAPEPVHGGGMPDRNVAVNWEVARDEGMQQVVRRGVKYARPEFAHSVHVDVEGLEPGREYFYRFVAGPQESPVGRTRTAPSKNASDGAALRVRLLPGLAERLLHGLPAARRGGRRSGRPSRRLHLRVRAGGQDAAGVAAGARPRRARGVLSRELPEPARALQDRRCAAGGTCGRAWVLTWDDHEIENNYAGEIREEGATPPGDFADAFGERGQAPTTSTSPCASPPCWATRGRSCTGGSTGAASRSSTCSTRGSSEPTSRAATG